MLGNSITIIGGSGGLGQVFAKLFKRHGFEVTLMARSKAKLVRVANKLDVRYELNLEKSVSKADLIMISIPIHSTPAMIRKIGPMLKKDALIFDVTSLKREAYPALDEICRQHPINSLSLHPMFGPGIKNMRNYNMIFLEVGGTKYFSKKVNALRNLFQSEGLHITNVGDPEEHDKMMAIVLGAPHMINILFIEFLQRIGIPLSKLMEFTGTTFLLQKIFAESIIQREVEMFGEIQMDNPQFHKIFRKFKELVDDYSSIMETKNLERFKEIFSKGIQYSNEDPHFERSYEFFYKFMKILKQNENE
ncbi:MAG: putative Chorismate mutase [Promethearchaeota archaeon]|nr:MAG: putative Chorismate mutase [Candidatus Lokiarchaeota archaeon]